MNRDDNVIETPDPTEAPVEEVVETPDPTPEPEPEPQPFDFDEWDGSAETVPDEVRDFVRHARERGRLEVERAMEEQQRQLEAYRERYATLIQGKEDPRVKELETKAEKLERERAEALAKYEEVKALEEKTRTEAETIVSGVFRQRALEFKQANPWIFDGAETEKLAVDLSDANISMSDLPELLRLKGEQRDKAIAEAKENPSAARYIARLYADPKNGEILSPETPGTSLVNGAEDPATTSPTPAPKVSRKLSLHEQAVESARKYGLP